MSVCRRHSLRAAPRRKTQQVDNTFETLRRLDVVDFDFLAAGVAALVVARVGVVVAELEVALAILVGAVGIGLVDLGGLGQLAIGLERTGLIGVVLEDNVTLVVLVITQRQEDDIAVVDPDLLSQLASDVGKTLGTIKALRMTVSILIQGGG